jgi:hypothetical protein
MHIPCWYTKTAFYVEVKASQCDDVGISSNVIGGILAGIFAGIIVVSF